MAVENKQFAHRGFDGVFENHHVNEGSHRRFMFPNINAPVAIVTAFCADGKGTAHITETDEASMVFFDGQEGHENGVLLGSNVTKDFKEGESVAVIDTAGNNTWLFTYSQEQGVVAEPLNPIAEALKKELVVPNNQTTARDRLKSRELLAVR